jgi:hypothetical protein
MIGIEILKPRTLVVMSILETSISMRGRNLITQDYYTVRPYQRSLASFEIPEITEHSSCMHGAVA